MKHFEKYATFWWRSRKRISRAEHFLVGKREYLQNEWLHYINLTVAHICGRKWHLSKTPRLPFNFPTALAVSSIGRRFPFRDLESQLHFCSLHQRCVNCIQIWLIFISYRTPRWCWDTQSTSFVHNFWLGWPAHVTRSSIDCLGSPLKLDWCTFAL